MGKDNEMKVIIASGSSSEYSNLERGMKEFALCYGIYGKGSVIVSGPGVGQTIWIEPYQTRNRMMSKSVIEKVEGKSPKKGLTRKSLISMCDLTNMEIALKVNETHYLIFF